jgi:hypothetical protein
MINVNMGSKNVLSREGMGGAGALSKCEWCIQKFKGREANKSQEGARDEVAGHVTNFELEYSVVTRHCIFYVYCRYFSNYINF